MLAFGKDFDALVEAYHTELRQAYAWHLDEREARLRDDLVAKGKFTRAEVERIEQEKAQQQGSIKRKLEEFRAKALRAKDNWAIALAIQQKIDEYLNRPTVTAQDLAALLTSVDDLIKSLRKDEK